MRISTLGRAIIQYYCFSSFNGIISGYNVWCDFMVHNSVVRNEWWQAHTNSKTSLKGSDIFEGIMFERFGLISHLTYTCTLHTMQFNKQQFYYLTGFHTRAEMALHRISEKNFPMIIILVISPIPPSPNIDVSNRRTPLWSGWLNKLK